MLQLAKSRKGQTGVTGVNSLGDVAITILVAAVIIAFSATILTQIKDNQPGDSTIAFGNQTLTWAGNNTAIAFETGTVVTSSVILYNNATVVNRGGVGGNYSVDAGSITILNQTIGGADGFGNGSWMTDDLNASYDFTSQNIARNVSTFGLTGLTTFASFIPVIAVIVIAAIVIGIVLIMFGRKKPNEF